MQHNFPFGFELQGLVSLRRDSYALGQRSDSNDEWHSACTLFERIPTAVLPHQRTQEQSMIIACVLVIVTAQAATLRYALPLAGDKKATLLLISIASSAGLFIVLFRATLALYQRFVWRIMNRRYWIDGKWHVEITKPTAAPGHLFGTVLIDQSWDSISFSAMHYTDEAMTQLWSTWTSSHVHLTKEVIELNWTVTLESGSRGFGRMQLTFDGQIPPKELTGMFFDDKPLRTRGQVRMRRL